VPPDDCFGLEDEKCLFPRVECIGQDVEEELIGWPQSGYRARTSEYFQLFSEEDDLHLKLNP